MNYRSREDRLLFVTIGFLLAVLLCSCGEDVVTGNEDGNVTEPGWIQQNVQPTLGVLRDVYAHDAETVVAVGAGVWTTTNAGETWTGRPFSGGTSLSFVDANRGWKVVGGEGCFSWPSCNKHHSASISATTDGGATWVSQESWHGLLSGVFFVDAQTGWAVGHREIDDPSGELPDYHVDAILSTTDGGATWTLQFTGARTTWGLQGVYFVNAEVGFAVGGEKILRTNDGGQKWWSRSVAGAFLTDVFFADANCGWAVGHNGLILGTTDGGAVWTEQISGTTSDLWNSYFVDANTGWVVGHRDLVGMGTDLEVVLKTTDAGKTWVPQSWGAARAVALSGVSFSDANTGWVVGNGTALATTNGGVTWSSRSGEPVTGTLWAVSFVDANLGWAVGNELNHATILVTEDGGETWVLQYFGTGMDVEIDDVVFVDANTGWAVGTGGRIVATLDGGTTWNPQTSGTPTHLYGVSFSNANTGWAVGGAATILATTDGGATWSPQTSGVPIDTELRAVTFVDASTGWAVGSGGTVLATTDGGDAWTSQTSGTSVPLSDVCFIDTSVGWVVGEQGKILATTDGGKTWTTKRSGTSEVYSAVCFTDSSTGWIASWDPPRVLATTDGGETWNAQSGTINRLTDISFVDGTTGWVVGAGVIFKTTTGGRNR